MKLILSKAVKMFFRYACRYGLIENDISQWIPSVHKYSEYLHFNIDTVCKISVGLEKAASDLDAVVEYRGRESKDDLFNALNEDGLQSAALR